MRPDTRYARSGDVHIAWQAFGEGDTNLVMIPPFVSHIENFWDQPDCARWLLRLGAFARVVMFDKRGTGMSDRVADLPGVDQRMDDVRAVMDAAGIDRAALLGISEALVTTAFGLLVAIPAVMFFNYFTNRVEEIMVDVNDSTTELVDFIIKEGR